jgi:hypothetical protein
MHYDMILRLVPVPQVNIIVKVRFSAIRLDLMSGKISGNCRVKVSHRTREGA